MTRTSLIIEMQFNPHPILNQSTGAAVKIKAMPPSTNYSCKSKSSDSASALKPSYRKGGKPAKTAVRPYRAVAFVILAAAMSFCAGTICRIISLRNISGVSSSSHQFQDKDFPTPIDLTSHNDDASPHLPTGQSLFADIRHADTTILNSEDRLVSAMMELVKETNDVFLYCHCHALQPMGLSCVGASAESHVS